MTAQPLAPTTAFREPARIRLGETDLPGVLDRASHLAARTVPGASDVSVTLVREGAAGTAAHTGRPVLSTLSVGMAFARNLEKALAVAADLVARVQR